jgi:hypothetical protein
MKYIGTKKRFKDRDKEWRAGYNGSKRFAHECRNHGSCKWCEDGRTFSNKRRKLIGED